MPLNDADKNKAFMKLLQGRDNLNEKSRALLAAVNEKAAQNGINISEQNDKVVADLFSNLHLSNVLGEEEAVDQLFEAIEIADRHQKGLNSLLQANPGLTDEGQQLLTALYEKLVNEADNLELDRQTPDIKAIAVEGVKSQADNPGALDHLFNLVKAGLQKQSDEAHTAFARQQELGVFNSLPLHERGLNDELQDHDMAFFMPKSAANIAVLSPANFGDQASLRASAEGIKLAIQNPTIDHIIFPVGPGHWRGVCLSKPSEQSENKFELELFDSNGSKGSEAIQQHVTQLLKESGLDASRVNIKLAEPKRPQSDIYACGDFTCAYSHQKMKALGATQGYNQTLIDTLVNQGNQRGALRAATRNLSQARSHGNSPVAAVNTAVVDTAKTVDSTVTSVERSLSVKYRNFLEGIINKRDEILEAADKLKEKETEQLTDEELATKLQAEELEKGGYRRGPF